MPEEKLKLPRLTHRRKPIVLLQTCTESVAEAIRQMEQLASIIREEMPVRGELDIIPTHLGHGPFRTSIDNRTHPRICLFDGNHGIFSFADHNAPLAPVNDVPADNSYAQIWVKRGTPLYSLPSFVRFIEDRIADLKRRVPFHTGTGHNPAIAAVCSMILEAVSAIFAAAGYSHSCELNIRFPRPDRKALIYARDTSSVWLTLAPSVEAALKDVLPHVLEVHLTRNGGHNGSRSQIELQFLAHMISLHTTQMSPVEAMKAISKYDLQPEDLLITRSPS